MKDEIQDLIGFLQNPTAFHAVDKVADILKSQGYHRFSSDTQDLREGEGYYIVFEGTIIVFRLPDLSKSTWENLTSLPLRLWGAHTDSPALKVKPRPTMVKHGHVQIGVGVYGGAILNTWLDRPLGVAGKIFASPAPASTSDDAQNPQSYLVKLEDSQVVIPNAAIHLNRNINKGFALLPDTHLPAFWTGGVGGNDSWLASLAQKSGLKGKILSHDLFLYDTQPPVLLGKEGELINSPRLDNLAMVHAGLRGFLRAKRLKKPIISAIAFFNHEEIGSITYEGAASGLLLEAIDSLYKGLEKISPRLNKFSSRENSFLISADMAHGFHPGYESWYEGNHRPLINGGPVIKYNASFRYTSSGSSVARIKNLLKSEESDLPIQEYLHHADILCGSTIGPMVSSRLAIPAVDIGNPLWAMHSIRETAGVKDHLTMIELAERFFQGR